MIYDGKDDSYTFTNNNPVYELGFHTKGIKKIINFDDENYEGGFIFAYRNIFMAAAISSLFLGIIFFYIKNKNIGLLDKINIDSKGSTIINLTVNPYKIIRYGDGIL